MENKLPKTSQSADVFSSLEPFSKLIGESIHQLVSNTLNTQKEHDNSTANFDQYTTLPKEEEVPTTYSPSTKMLTVTIDTTGIDPYEAHEWADELTTTRADMEVEDVNISENKISFKAGFSGMEDTGPSDISTRIEEYLTTNEAFQVTNISVSDGRQLYSASSYDTYNVRYLLCNYTNFVTPYNS